MRRAITASRGIAGDAAIATLIDMPVIHGLSKATSDDVIVGWGGKENTKSAVDLADKKGLEYWRLEDGFLGYLSHPSIDKRRLSLVVDKTGVYYDSTKPSDIENLLNDVASWITDEKLDRARNLIASIKKWRLSKYNHATFDMPKTLAKKLSGAGRKVLVVDQTYGDMSIKSGGGSAETFQEMLGAAISENPNADIFVKVHPDVLAGKKKGHFDTKSVIENVHYIADNCTPQALIEAVDHVYVVTSQMGLESLIAGKPVTCFGLPFYAGWGLTDDRQDCGRRIANCTVEELIAAAFIKYTRYVDPYTGQPSSLEIVLDYLIADRQLARPTGKRAFAVGFSLWKRGFIPQFCGSAIDDFVFVSPKNLLKTDIREDDCVIFWGRNHDALIEKLPKHTQVWRMEDGFLRSVGLGSDLRRPSSLVLDRSGIYYDGLKPSDLEGFLASHEFNARELERGRNLIASILASRVSKYNVGESGEIAFKGDVSSKEAILVPGQVEGDASLKFGSPEVFTNAALLQAVKKNNPDAYVIFKPHPDVVSGNREGVVPSQVLEECADEVIVDADIADCLDAVDSVHTMTSLTGFEALLRGKNVVTYGVPFYAGWGLTKDHLKIETRGRGLALEALVYGLLCVYARYVHWPSGLPYGPEALVAEIAAGNRGGSVAKSSPLDNIKRSIRKISFLLQAMLR